MPRGMKYEEKAGKRGTFFVSEDDHMWHKHGMKQKQDQGIYLRCVFGRPTEKMKEEGIKKCPGKAMYRAEKKSLQILLSSTQAGPGRKVKQEQ